MHIKVQQDNARPHVPVDHPEVVQAGKSDGFNISLMFQPPNSPDFNVLDLGFFNSIQALQQMESARTVDELILAVENALAMLSVEALNDAFLSLQMAMESTLKVGGGNDYKLAHMVKDVL